MKLLDLGTRDGVMLLFGGPYSNVQATLALLEEAKRRSIPADHMICTGDMVAYCADPAPTVAALRASGAVVVAGNCEQQLAADAGDCGCGFAPGSTCDRLSAGWYAHADAALDRDARDWMAGLPDIVLFRHQGLRCAVIHGGATDVARFVWPTDPDDVFHQEIAAIEAVYGPVDRVIAGHCGLAFTRQIDATLWINAGVIGMPAHHGAAQTRFAVMQGADVQILPLSYDHAAAQQAMRAAGLTQGYDSALSLGYWPSEDVLPPELRRAATASG